MSVRIDPTVGRIVWFYSTRDLGWGEHTDTPDKPRAAIVADVLAPDHVNLSVIDRFGTPHPMPSVRLVQDGDQRQDSEVHWAEWMPYQKGQAAKQEAQQGAQAGVGVMPGNREMAPDPNRGPHAYPQASGGAGAGQLAGNVPQQSPRRPPPPPSEEADLSSNETRPPHPKPLAPAALKDLSD